MECEPKRLKRVDCTVIYQLADIPCIRPSNMWSQMIPDTQRDKLLAGYSGIACGKIRDRKNESAYIWNLENSHTEKHYIFISIYNIKTGATRCYYVHSTPFNWPVILSKTLYLDDIDANLRIKLYNRKIKLRAAGIKDSDYQGLTESQRYLKFIEKGINPNEGERLIADVPDPRITAAGLPPIEQIENYKHYTEEIRNNVFTKEEIAETELANQVVTYKRKCFKLCHATHDDVLRDVVAKDGRLLTIIDVRWDHLDPYAPFKYYCVPAEEAPATVAKEKYFPYRALLTRQWERAIILEFKDFSLNLSDFQKAQAETAHKIRAEFHG